MEAVSLQTARRRIVFRLSCHSGLGCSSLWHLPSLFWLSLTFQVVGENNGLSECAVFHRKGGGEEGSSVQQGQYKKTHDSCFLPRSRERQTHRGKWIKQQAPDVVKGRKKLTGVTPARRKAAGERWRGRETSCREFCFVRIFNSKRTWRERELTKFFLQTPFFNFVVFFSDTHFATFGPQEEGKGKRIHRWGAP